MAVDRAELAGKSTWIQEHKEIFKSDNPWMADLEAALTRMTDGQADATLLSNLCGAVAQDGLCGASRSRAGRAWRGAARKGLAGRGMSWRAARGEVAQGQSMPGVARQAGE